MTIEEKIAAVLTEEYGETESYILIASTADKVQWLEYGEHKHITGAVMQVIVHDAGVRNIIANAMRKADDYNFIKTSGRMF